MTQTLTGRGVLLWLVVFFGMIFATNAVFITAAVKTFRGEDVEKPYLQGLAYNQTLARRAEQLSLGWHATMKGERLASGAVAFDVDIRDAAGLPRAGLVLNGELRHPADETRDRSLQLRQVAPGMYKAVLNKVSTGAWDLAITNQGKLPFQASRRLWLR